MYIYIYIYNIMICVYIQHMNLQAKNKWYRQRATNGFSNPCKSYGEMKTLYPFHPRGYISMFDIFCGTCCRFVSLRTKSETTTQSMGRSHVCVYIIEMIATPPPSLLV